MSESFNLPSNPRREWWRDSGGCSPGGGVFRRPAGIVCYAGVLFLFYGIKHDNIHLQGGNINVLQGLNETIRQTNSINKKLIWSGVRGVLMLSWCCVLMVLVKVWYLVSDVCVFLCWCCVLALLSSVMCVCVFVLVLCFGVVVISDVCVFLC